MTDAFAASHRIPPSGLDVWVAPDPSVPASARLEAGVEVHVREWRGEWAEVVCDNGFTGWLAGAHLEPVTAPVVDAVPGQATTRPVLPGMPPAGYYAALYENAERGPVASPAALVLAASAVAPAGPAGTAEGAADRHAPARPASITAVGIGAVVTIVGGFLPWFGFEFVSVSGYEIPLLFVVSKGSFAEAGIDGGLVAGGPTIGLACLLAALAGVLCSRRASTDRFRRLLGGLIVLLPTMALGQVQLLLREQPAVGTSTPGLLSVVSIGLLVTIVGGLVLALAPRARGAAAAPSPTAPEGAS